MRLSASSERAVNGGFYAPTHISLDPDLDSIRDTPRYEAALAKAVAKAKEQGPGWKRLVDRLINSIGVIDHVASIETTEGYAVWTQTVVSLVPDAAKRPAYPLLATHKELMSFDPLPAAGDTLVLRARRPRLRRVLPVPRRHCAQLRVPGRRAAGRLGAVPDFRRRKRQE